MAKNCHKLNKYFLQFLYKTHLCIIPISINYQAQKMAGLKPIAALIVLNIIFFTSVSSTYVACPPQPTPLPPSTPKPAPLPPSTTPVKPAKCPKDTLKFGVCGDWLGLVHEVIGTKPSSNCCAVLEGLADLEAALCLCTAIKANVLGILKFKIPVAISLVINSCGKKVPEGFAC